MGNGIEIIIAILLLIAIALLGFMDNRLRSKNAIFIAILCSTPIIANLLQYFLGIHSSIIFLAILIIYIVATKNNNKTAT
ncbi:hypothetical protein [Shewanella sp. Isolate7]|uniref:hypothetical protein n=1 Tax=Shewanella sp. Isolate7 TaxID=2908528 RepID=UPI001EFE2179|nr:hypothetical protein [Shewanella sp. Isolate7]MCG9723633.1 hypothetical protein [Shewanella sp. Isolate7]